MKKVYLSIGDEDEATAMGLEFPRWKGKELEITGRHLAPHLAQGNDDAIKAFISEHLAHSELTIVVLGQATSGNRFVDYEIEQSRRERKVLLGVRLNPLAPVPPALLDAGAEVVDSDADSLEGALERARIAARRAAAVVIIGENLPDEEDCHRELEPLPIASPRDGS